MKIRNTEIKIIRDDITALTVDAIVNPAGPRLAMESGLSGLLKQKGGHVIEAEALERASVEPGMAVVTNAGQLKANFIIHAVTTNAEGQTCERVLRGACSQALVRSQEFHCRTLAIPALGCGNTGFSGVASAKIISQEIIKFLKFNATDLREIILCLSGEEMFMTFDQTVRGYITHIQDDLGNGPYVTVDIIIELDEGVVLIERSNPPFGWALPGGFVDYGETIEQAAIREAKEETNMDLECLRQFHAYSDPGRDPRFHTVSTVFIAKGKGQPRWGDDAKGLQVIPYKDLMNRDYAFDHKKIIEDYLEGNINPKA